MNRAVNVGLIILVVFVVGVAAATIPVSNDLPLQTNTGFTVTLDNPGQYPASNPFTASDTITLSSGTVTAAGSGSLVIPNGGDLTGTTTELTQIDVATTTAEIDPSDKSQFDITGSVTAIGVETTITPDDGSGDFDYTSTGSFTLTLRGLSPNQAYVALDSTGTQLGTGTADGTGELDLSMTATGTNTAEIVSNDAPTLANLAPDGTTETDPDVELSVDVDDTSFSKLGGDSIDVEFYDGSNTQIGSTQTITSASTVTQTFTQTTNGNVDWYVEATDQYGETTTSATQSFTMSEPAPVFGAESPGDGTQVSEPPLNLSINVTDAGLGDYDTVTVEFYDASDDSLIGSDTLTANGSASTTWSDPASGANQWYAEASDTFGNDVTSSTFTVTIPELLTLRDVNDPGTILQSPTIEATVRFYESEPGDSTVYPRTPSNGEIDMSGLPTQQEFVVGVDDSSDTYAQRLTLLDSIFQQQEVYLLNNSADTAIATLLIEDRTGAFETGETSIQIERSVNTTGSPAGEEEYIVVAGDVIGTQLEFSTTLEQDVRYRVTVENDVGDSRQLGSFTLQQDRVIRLVISGIDVGVPIPENEPVFETSQSVDDNTGDKDLTFTYIDAAQETSEVTVEVVEAGNESNVLATGSNTGDIGTYQFSETLTGDDAELTVLAKITYIRNGQTFTDTVPFGANEFPVNIPLSQEWKNIFSVGFLLVMAGIFSVANARVGAIVLPGIAGVLYLTGFMTGVTTILGIALAFTVGVAVNLVQGSTGAYR
jgi:hypothetical protein